LLRAELPVKRVRALIVWAARIASDPEADARGVDVDTTGERVAACEEVTGFPTAAEIVDRRVLDAVGRWVGARTNNADGLLSARSSNSSASVPVLPPAPTFPVEAVPGAARALVTAAAASLDAPPDLVAVPLLA
jgi:hypothetical protein